MATLRETAYYTKNIAKFGSIGLLVLIIFKLVFDVGKTVWLKYNPPGPPPPTVAFGKLPDLEFPQKIKTGALQFKLETPTGALPSFSSQAKVFLMPAQKARLLALEKAKKKAVKLGFDEEPKPVSEKIFLWSNKSPSVPTLEMNIFSETFILSTNWQNEQEAIIQKSPPDKNQAINKAKNYLSTVGILTNDLEEGETIASYLKISQGKMVSAISLSEANFVKVNIFRKSVEEMPVLTPDPEKGIATIIMAGSGSFGNQNVEIEFNHRPVDYDSFATYPLKANDQAWKELETNLAFIARWNGEKKVTIRRIYLAYFDSWEAQEYLQPIFVFEGDGNFTAYVHAVSQEWIE